MPLVFDAVLLAAGRSRRMGSDKALLLSSGAGERLWERQWRLLGEAGAARRWLSVRADQSWAPAEISSQVVRDGALDGGPLSGVVAAWKRSDASHLMVLAVDLPHLPAAWFVNLQQKCREGRGAVGSHPDGSFEPLAGIYPRAWLPMWEAAMGEGRRSLQMLLATAAERNALAIEPIGPEQRFWFHNVNAPGDLV